MTINAEERAMLAIIDADVIHLIQPTKPLHYLCGIPGLKIVPSRRAREQANVFDENFVTPLSPGMDAPVPMRTNNPKRRTNDPAVLVGPTRGMIEATKMKNTVYAKSTTNKHQSDQEIIGSAVELYYSERLEYAFIFFISADHNCCKKAREFFAREQVSIEVLHARVPPAKRIEGIRTVQEVFVP